MHWWSRTSAEGRILSLAAAVFVLDQLSKLAVVSTLRLGEERAVLPGFFTFVHWGNTGSAWSLFRGNNHLLAGVAVLALASLWWGRRQFESHRLSGQFALGFLFGGIVGNLLDRVLPGRRHVVDFLYFHLHPREGGEIGFPAFNVADMAICTGVGLLILISWTLTPDRAATAPASEPASTGTTTGLGSSAAS